jgi:hypothetical protein
VVGVKNLFIPTEVYSIPLGDDEFSIEIKKKSDQFKTEESIIFKPQVNVKSILIHQIIRNLDEELVSFLRKNKIIVDNDTSIRVIDYSPMIRKVKIQGIGVVSRSNPIPRISYTFNTGIAKLLGFTPHIPIDEGSVGSVFPEYTSGITAIYVYTNIVQHSQTGDTYTNIVDIVPYGSTYSKNSDIIYKKLKSNSIQSIKIEMRDQNGRVIPFVDGGSATIILHFKKI